MIAPAPDDLWALELAKARQAAGPDAPAGGGFWPAALIGLAAWLRTVLTTPAGDPLPDAPLVAALHGEIANRTRHVITALAAEAPDTPVLLLGRPQLGRAALRRALSDAGLSGPLVRPFDLPGALAALPAIVRRLGQGARAVAAADWRPATRDLAAICFRVMLGETHARWAAAHIPAGPRTVVFGHTGVADSNLLERAVQARGARTVHWVHGVSLGLNFVGGSNLAVFQCGADARWHQALGGYDRTISLPADAPEPAAGGDGWLVLSNLVHPMNADYRRHGLAGEIALLEAVAAAAGDARKVWKPHPILASLEADIRAAIESRAATLGFTRWREGDDLARARDFAVVVSTPSTVALDVLKLGVLPILYGGADLDPASAIAQLPLKADSAATLIEAAGRLPAADFHAVWSAIAPGREPTLADLLA
ncbi:hypothetical protein [Caulobacter sp. NIBR1757]|uniref:hypothetical protein n=1 Tax=Caulobacter sp. NIBR1757 TaxID=3016000 RepID=UPI0022F103F5|nr:hypothetical protein [Caulobacter sp. NIBR1757]WGM41118.1 hypothetical protein AMEJIAPC_04066 [Caulobacter sp. NIBR1757]